MTVYNDILEKLKKAIILMDKYLRETCRMSPLTPRELLLERATKMLGVDVTPGDEISDVYSCAWSLTQGIVKFVAPSIEWTYPASTDYCARDMRTGRHFKQIDPKDALPGDVYMYATVNPTIFHGHVFVRLMGDRLASNRSKDGLWGNDWTIAEADRFYHVLHGLRLEVFRLIAL